MPSAPYASPGFLLWHTTLRWQRAIAETLRPFGLTQVQLVLLAGVVWMQEREGAPTQRMLADFAGTDPMMTSQVLRNLERKGLITRAGDDQDKRVNRLRPTARGVETIERALPAVQSTDDEFFGSRAGDAVALFARLAGLTAPSRG